MFVLSGSIPDLPEYGSSELQGGYLQLYSNTNQQVGNRVFPQLSGYMLNKDVSLLEGNYNLATSSGSTTAGAAVIGNKTTIINSKPLSLAPSVYESFEGI